MQKIISIIEKVSTPAKMQWQKPELFVLDNENVNTPGAGKTDAAFHENTGGGHAASYFS